MIHKLKKLVRTIRNEFTRLDLVKDLVDSRYLDSIDAIRADYPKLLETADALSREHERAENVKDLYAATKRALTFEKTLWRLILPASLVPKVNKNRFYIAYLQEVPLEIVTRPLNWRTWIGWTRWDVRWDLKLLSQYCIENFNKV